MNKPPVSLMLSWPEAANLLVAAQQVDTTGWSRASKGHLRRACEIIASRLPMPDPNDLFLVVRGQTVVSLGRRKGGRS